jgi:nucleoside phosphorylase
MEGTAPVDRTSVTRTHLHAAINKLRRDPTICEELDKYVDLSQPLTADVLVVTATTVENDSFLDGLKAFGFSQHQKIFSGVSSCMLFPSVYGTAIALVRAQMGSLGPGGSALTVAEAIRTVRPRAVIMVGIAFGVDRARQKIGEVLIAEQLLDYETKRIGTGPSGELRIEARGPRTPASARLIDRFHAARLHCKGLSISYGLVLSGDKLVDNVDYRKEINTMAVEAIGGEMEGRGLYAAASRANVDWLLVKAICDWADGRKKYQKKARQLLAARNAAEAVILVIREGGLA